MVDGWAMIPESFCYWEEEETNGVGGDVKVIGGQHFEATRGAVRHVDMHIHASRLKGGAELGRACLCGSL